MLPGSDRRVMPRLGSLVPTPEVTSPLMRLNSFFGVSRSLFAPPQLGRREGQSSSSPTERGQRSAYGKAATVVASGRETGRKNVEELLSQSTYQDWANYALIDPQSSGSLSKTYPKILNNKTYIKVHSPWYIQHC